MYRKPTHTERYIPYHSHHHPRTTTGVLRCMRDRARSICHHTKMQQERDHLNQVFQANGFPENLVKKTLTTHPPPLPETSEPQQQLDEAPKILCTPYIKGLSEKIAKVCVPVGVKPVFRPKKILKRTNAGEEQDPRAEADRSGVRNPVRIAQRCMWEKPRGH